MRQAFALAHFRQIDHRVNISTHQSIELICSSLDPSIRSRHNRSSHNFSTTSPKMVDGDHDAGMAEERPTQQSLLDVLTSSAWCLNRETLVGTFGESALDHWLRDIAADTIVAYASEPGISASAQTQQHVLNQLTNPNRLDGSAMETILPFWLPPGTRHLNIDASPSSISFCLRCDWCTDVGDCRNLFAVLYHSTRHDWKLLHIQLDEANVVAYDPLRAGDPCIKEAFKAIVNAMDLDWDRDGWSFTAAQCPQQQNDHDSEIFVLLYAMHLSVEIPLPSSAIMDGDLWRMLFTLLVRKTPLTVQETASILLVDTADSVDLGDVSSPCQQLLRLYNQISEKLDNIKSKRSSLGHARRLLMIFSRLCEFLDADTSPLADRLASNRKFLEEVRARSPAGNLHDGKYQRRGMQIVCTCHDLIYPCSGTAAYIQS